MLLIFSLSYCQHVFNTPDNSVKAKWILFKVLLFIACRSSHRGCVKYHWFNGQCVRSQLCLCADFSLSFSFRFGALKWLIHYEFFLSKIYSNRILAYDKTTLGNDPFSISNHFLIHTLFFVCLFYLSLSSLFVFYHRFDSHSVVPPTIRNGMFGFG